MVSGFGALRATPVPNCAFTIYIPFGKCPSDMLWLPALMFAVRVMPFGEWWVWGLMYRVGVIGWLAVLAIYYFRYMFNIHRRGENGNQ